MKYLKTLRPEQWYKNLVVLVPMLFAEKLFNFQAWTNLVIALASFCLISSSGYIFNDLRDIEEDRIKNPTRPIASGKITRKTAVAISIPIGIIGLVGLWYVNVETLMMGCTYLALSIFYTLFLRPHSYLGLSAIGLGFVLRAIAGSTAINTPTLIWLLTCVFTLSLLLSSAKRERRESQVLLAIILLFTYTLYTIQNGILILTVIPAGYIIYKYLRLQPAPIMKVLRNKTIQGAIAVWVVSVGLIPYIL